MAIFIYANNASTTLAGSVSSGATSVTVASGTGSLFPSPSAGEQFVFTFTDAATGALTEITYCTARSGDVLTIVRAREGTTARAWAVGDKGSNLWTRDSAAALAQVAAVQGGATNYAVDSGTANAAVVALTPALTTYVAGLTIRVKKTATQNSGGVTINVNALGAKSIVAPDGSALTQGQLPASGVFTITYDGTNFVLQSGVATALTGVCAEYVAPTPPANALIRDGAAISRTGYPGLNAIAAAASYADPWGPGDGSATFNVPNDGGLFPRWWVSGQAIDPGRGFGSVQADQVGEYTENSYGVVTQGSLPFTRIVVNSQGGVAGTFTHNTGLETRVRNRAYLPIIFI